LFELLPAPGGQFFSIGIIHLWLRTDASIDSHQQSQH